MISLREIAEFRGAPLACLLVMGVCRRPVSEIELIRYTGYNRNTVGAALKRLTDPVYGKVLRVTGGWCLANQPMLVDNSVDNSAQIAPNVELINICSTTTINTGNESLEKESSKSKPKCVKNKHFGSPVWEALKAAGIYPNNRTQALAEMAHITPEYIRSMKAVYPRRGDVGFLIQALENNEQPAAEEAVVRRSFVSSAFELLDADEIAEARRELDAEREAKRVSAAQEMAELDAVTNKSPRQYKRRAELAQIVYGG